VNRLPGACANRPEGLSGLDGIVQGEQNYGPSASPKRVEQMALTTPSASRRAQISGTLAEGQGGGIPNMAGVEIGGGHRTLAQDSGRQSGVSICLNIMR